MLKNLLENHLLTKLFRMSHLLASQVKQQITMKREALSFNFQSCLEYAIKLIMSFDLLINLILAKYASKF